MPVRRKDDDGFIKIREDCMGSDFKKSFLSQEFSDISVLFRNDSIPCHKLVLTARCEYFRRALQKTDVEHEFDIAAADATQDCTCDDFKATIFYLYTGTLPDEDQGPVFDPLHVLALAEKLGLPRLKELCEKSIASNCNCSRRVRRSAVISGKNLVEDFVKKNLKNAIDAYICARRLKAHQLEQLMLFNICSNADLVKSHLDGCLKGAFGADLTAQESLSVIRETVKLTSNTVGSVQRIKNGMCTTTLNHDSEEIPALRLQHEAFRQAVIDDVAFHELCGDFSPPDPNFEYGAYSEAMEMREAIHGLAFPTAAKFFDKDCADSDEEDEDQDVDREAAFAAAILSDCMRETSAEMKSLNQRRKSLEEMSECSDSSDAESDGGVSDELQVPTSLVGTSASKPTKRIPSAYNSFMKTGKDSLCCAPSCFCRSLVRGLTAYLGCRGCKDQGSSTETWPQGGLPASYCKLAGDQSAAGRRCPSGCASRRDLPTRYSYCALSP
jgi:hypothetical protein